MSLAKRIIPCLDVDNGRVVKGVNFLNIKDAGDPIMLAEKYSNDRLEAACLRAVAYDNYAYKAISNILKNNLDQQSIQSFGIEKWADIFFDPVMANAALDRIVNKAYRLVLEGDSYRKNFTPKLQNIF